MRRLVVALVVAAVAVTASPAVACVGLIPPVDGPVIAAFAPQGQYAGHWGIDVGADHGTTVHAAGPGVVSFAGSVAGLLAVTIDHGGGLKSTVSSLADITVGRGWVLGRGAPLGHSGDHDGRPAVHVSTRVDGRYVDPVGILGCAATSPAGAVRLVPLP